MCDLVRAYPYTVPEWLPDVTVFLANFTRGNHMIAVSDPILELVVELFAHTIQLHFPPFKLIAPEEVILGILNRDRGDYWLYYQMLTTHSIPHRMR